MCDISKLLPEEIINIDEKFKSFFKTYFSNDIIEYYNNYIKLEQHIQQPKYYQTNNFIKYFITDKIFNENLLTSNYIKYKWCDKSKYTLYVYVDIKDNGPFYEIYNDLKNDKWFGDKFNYNICEIIKFNHKYDIIFNEKEFTFFCLYLYFNHIQFKFTGNEECGSIYPTSNRFNYSIINKDNDLNVILIFIGKHHLFIYNKNEIIENIQNSSNLIYHTINISYYIKFDNIIFNYNTADIPINFHLINLLILRLIVDKLF